MVGKRRRWHRGQVGIGTLIVFIAMVLVAAMASGVLVNTAGFLQTKSEQTGQESVDSVVNRLQVTSKVGRVPGMGNRNYIVIDEGYEDRPVKDYDSRLRIPEGEKVRLEVTGPDQKLVIGGNNSPLYTAPASATYRISRVNGDQIRFEDLTNDEVVATVTPPVTIETTADEDVELSYPSDEIVSPDDQVFFGASSFGGETGTADFLGASKLWTANLTVAPSSGSGAIDLTDATLVYRSDERVAYLSYAGDGTANESAFAVETVRGNGDDVLQGTEQAKLTVDVDAIEGSRHGLPLSEDASVTILTRATKITIPLDPPSTSSGRPYVPL
ncbi:archaellin/type IV pilin N-terminal domain-containing protein [Halorussus pelagicus]|uniref:archaellin/type IV pilin N-terminal domain-containing protein n=1 Tax=Halorussus pelagicus TaxID=2505977 RepID=UPI000FFB726A